MKTIKFLVLFTESIKAKADKPVNVDKFFIRGDEIGKLTQSIDEMAVKEQLDRLKIFKQNRNHENLEKSISTLKKVADGNNNLLKVAINEIKEESGLTKLKTVSNKLALARFLAICIPIAPSPIKPVFIFFTSEYFFK